MKKSFSSNYIFNFLYEVIALLVLLFTTPYLSRVLGASGVGDYGFTSGIVSCFGLFAVLGTTNYATREVAIKQNNLIGRSKLFWEVFLLRLFCIGIVFIVYCIFVFYMGKHYFNLYIIQMLMFVSWLADISWFFRGIENFKIVSIQSSLVKVMGMLLVFVFVKTPTDLWKYTLIISLCFVLGNVVTWISLHKYIVFLPLGDLAIKRHLKGSLLFFSSVVAIQIYTVLDQTMLGLIVNTTEVGYYTQAQKMIKLALTVITVFVSILIPRIAVLYSENNKYEMNKFWELSLNYLCLFSMPMMVGCYFVSKDFVPIFLVLDMNLLFL